MGVILTSPRPTHGALNWDAIIEADLAALAASANYYASPTSGDLNAITRSGYYYVAGSTTANTPAASTSPFVVLAIVSSDGTNQTQLAHQYSSAASGALWVRNYRSGSWGAWGQVFSDTGWTTSNAGLVAVSGWTLNSFAYRILSGVVSFDATATKTTAATATANAQGVLSPVSVITLPSALIPSQSNGLLVSVGSAATVAASAYAQVAGTIAIASTTPSTAIPIGGVVDLKGSYFL